MKLWKFWLWYQQSIEIKEENANVTKEQERAKLMFGISKKKSPDSVNEEEISDILDVIKLPSVLLPSYLRRHLFGYTS